MIKIYCDKCGKLVEKTHYRILEKVILGYKETEFAPFERHYCRTCWESFIVEEEQS